MQLVSYGVPGQELPRQKRAFSERLEKLYIASDPPQFPDLPPAERLHSSSILVQSLFGRERQALEERLDQQVDVQHWITRNVAQSQEKFDSKTHHSFLRG